MMKLLFRLEPIGRCVSTLGVYALNRFGSALATI